MTVYLKRFFLFFILFHFGGFLVAQEGEKTTVYFRFNQHKLDKISKSKIDHELQKGEVSVVEIEGYCDAIGSFSYNDSLSMKRAKEIKTYLILHNPKLQNIVLRSYGKRKPVNKNETEGQRSLNRRAEVFFNLKEDENKSELSDSTILNLDDINLGSTVKLENLNFEGGRHLLLPKSNKTLGILLNTLLANSKLEIEIQGHICCITGPNDGYDFDTKTNNLSENRAKTIYDFLISNGIDSTRLSYKGFGPSMKLVEELTPEDESTNRRVEIKIIKK